MESSDGGYTEHTKFPTGPGLLIEDTDAIDDEYVTKGLTSQLSEDVEDA